MHSVEWSILLTQTMLMFTSPDPPPLSHCILIARTVCVVHVGLRWVEGHLIGFLLFEPMRHPIALRFCVLFVSSVVSNPSSDAFHRPMPPLVIALICVVHFGMGFY